MSEVPTVIGYNHFLLENNPLDIFRSIFSGKPIIENIANFCYTPKDPNSKNNINNIDYSQVAADAIASQLALNSRNALLYTGTFSSANGFCIPNGRCFECDSDGNCRDTSTGNYYSKSEMDNMYGRVLGVSSYILDKSNPNTFFKVGEIGNNTINGTVIEGFTSNIKRNTGEYERYLNILYMYNKSMTQFINIILGIICLFIIILYLHRI